MGNPRSLSTCIAASIAALPRRSQRCGHSAARRPATGQAAAVAPGSAFTTSDAEPRGSRCPPSSTRICDTSAWFWSHRQSGFEVGSAPQRTTAVGGSVSSAPAAARRSAAATTVPECGPKRIPDCGSARTAALSFVASRSSSGAAVDGTAPTTKSTRSPPTVAARRSEVAGSGTRVPTVTAGGAAVVGGARWSARSGSRKGRLRCTGPAGDSSAVP